MLRGLFFSITWLSLASAALHATAQEVTRKVTGQAIIPDLMFTRFSSKDGMPDNRVRAVYQDSRGFLWVGTMNGVSRYDGYTFKKYVDSAAGAITTGYWTYAICEDRDQNLWIGTLDGLRKFDVKTEQFNDYNVADRQNLLFCNEITALHCDQNNLLWVGTRQGLATFDPETGRFSRMDGAPFDARVFSIIPSVGDFIWIGTSEGIIRYDTRTRNYKPYNLQVKPNSYGDRFWALYEDNFNLYIATTTEGLVRLRYTDSEAGDFKHLNTFSNNAVDLKHSEIFDICKSRTGDFWLATSNGLAKVEHMGTSDARISLFRNNPLNHQSLSNNTVYKVFIDNADLLWCGTELGLNKLNLNFLPFQYYTFSDPKAFDQVRSLYTRDGENVWLGTAKYGFHRYNMKQNVTASFRFATSRAPMNAQRSIFVDDQHHLFLGTLDGVVQLDEGDPRRAIKLVEDEAVFSFLEDRSGNTWVGTNMGLYRIDAEGNRTVFSASTSGTNRLPAKFVRTLYEDESGRIWIGFEMGGIAYYHPAQQRVISIPLEGENRGLTQSIVYTMTESPKNTLWVGSDAGLTRITITERKTGDTSYQTKHYTELDGLSDRAICGLLADRRGFLWISTIKGLLKFDVNKELFQQYLTSINFSYSCYQKFDDTRFLFGTSEGFILFNPENIPSLSPAPSVMMSEFKLFNRDVPINKKVNGQVVLTQTISQTKEIELNYKNNVITLGFTGLHFANPESNRYAFRMMGFDKDWNYVDATNRTATYTNLDPGVYHFYVKAANSFGKWTVQPEVLKITILNPPWKTWWAITGYAVIFVVLAYAVTRYLVRQSRQRQQIRFEQHEREQLERLHQQKLEFFTNVSHEFRTPLSLIVGPVEALLADKSDISWGSREKLRVAQRNCKNLLYLLDELMTFRKLDQEQLKLRLSKTDIVAFVREITQNFDDFAQHKKIELSFKSQLDALPMWFDQGRLQMVLNNLLFNAFRFTKAGDAISVFVSREAEEYGTAATPTWLKIAVCDNGVGIAREHITHIFDRFYQVPGTDSGTGIGLTLAKSLVELHKGILRVQSEPGTHTCFTIELPLQSPHLSQPMDVPEETERQPENFRDVGMRFPNQVSSTEEEKHEDEQSMPLLLLVDDNPEVLDFLEMIFRGKYRMARALNGKEALATMEREEPATVISDVMMPEMDGIALCRTLKNQLSTCHIPVILLTAKAAVEHAMDGIEGGADDYIPKPFNPDYLCLRVEKLLEAQHRMVARFRAGLMIASPSISVGKADKELLDRVIQHIRDNMDNDEFSVEDLGCLVGMSRSHLFRKLKTISGTTPIEFIYQIRLSYSLELLREGRRNIAEVAYEVGFKNPSSFSKSFRKQYGKSPKAFQDEWEKKTRKKSDNPVNKAADLNP